MKSAAQICHAPHSRVGIAAGPVAWEGVQGVCMRVCLCVQARAVGQECGGGLLPEMWTKYAMNSNFMMSLIH